MTGLRATVLLAGAALAAAPALAQGNRTPVDLSRYFEPKVDVMSPMRDGARRGTAPHRDLRAEERPARPATDHAGANSLLRQSG